MVAANVARVHALALVQADAIAWALSKHALTFVHVTQTLVHPATAIIQVVTIQKIYSVTR